MSSETMGLRAYGGEIGVHRHDHHQIVLPHLGRMDIEVEGRGGAVLAGTGAFITAGTTHTFVAAPPGAFVVVDLPCSPGAIERASSAYACNPFFPVVAPVQGLLDHLDASLACGVMSAEGWAAWTLLLVEALARESEASPDRNEADQSALTRYFQHKCGVPTRRPRRQSTISRPPTS